MVRFLVAFARRFDDRLRRTAANVIALVVLIFALISVASLERL